MLIISILPEAHNDIYKTLQFGADVSGMQPRPQIGWKVTGGSAPNYTYSSPASTSRPELGYARQLAALDATLPRSVEDLITHLNIDVTKLPQQFQDNLKKKQEFRMKYSEFLAAKKANVK